jgi:hypothetical protein
VPAAASRSGCAGAGEEKPVPAGFALRCPGWLPQIPVRRHYDRPLVATSRNDGGPALIRETPVRGGQDGCPGQGSVCPSSGERVRKPVKNTAAGA